MSDNLELKSALDLLQEATTCNFLSHSLRGNLERVIEYVNEHRDEATEIDWDSITGEITTVERYLDELGSNISNLEDTLMAASSSLDDLRCLIGDVSGIAL